MPTHLDSIREDVANMPRKGPKDNLIVDRFDHIFGNFLTSKGKVRRMDLIIAPAEEEAFCILGWTGSRQWLRYLRLYASQRGMYLNSHRLMRKGEDGRAYIIPDEVPPLDRAKQPFWPPGWGPGCKVTCERDILELLEIPYREPHERNCP
ncbi:hypothetical protein WJX72_000290 [[Myrmecia] bisecta]|uniref:DNA polymerase n=1 Tax=[Myrmecia] bisecta TaxID=41462 RepID=A0AAW1P6Y1_9CHLO